MMSRWFELTKRVFAHDALLASCCVAITSAACHDPCTATPVAGTARPAGLALTVDELMAQVSTPQEIAVTWVPPTTDVPFDVGITGPDVLHVEVMQDGSFLQSYATGSDGCSPNTMRAPVTGWVTSQADHFRQSLEGESIQLLDAERGLRMFFSAGVQGRWNEEIAIVDIVMEIHFDATGAAMSATGTVRYRQDGEWQESVALTGP